MFATPIRLRLPLTYAGLALLTALLLGVTLLLTLRRYYQDQELRFLRGNAREISLVLGQFLEDGKTNGPGLQSKMRAFSFLSQARIKLFDSQHALLADSGPMQARTRLALGGSITRTAVFTEPFDAAVPLGTVPVDLLIPLAVQDEVSASSNPGTSPYGRAMISDTLADGSFITRSQVVFVNRSPFGFDIGPDGAALDASARSTDLVETTVQGAHGQAIGTVELSEGQAYGRDIVDAVARIVTLASLLAVGLAAAVGWFASRSLTTPLLTLTQVTEQMAAGDLTVRAAVAQRDELGQLARSFNHMAQQVEDTVDSLRRFVADAAHELNTPLTALRANLELATSVPPGEAGDYVARSLAQLDRIQHLAAGLLDLSRIEAQPARHDIPVDLAALVRNLSEVHASRAEQAALQFVLELPDQPVWLTGDATQLTQAIGNVLDNAIKFTPAGGTVTLSLAQTGTGTGAQLCVRDTGIGIPEGDRNDLFERFHRGRNAHAHPGNGLGLAITHAIVTGHGGAVAAVSSEHGSLITLSFPV
jgi:signal transduction histidine kinase